MLYNGFTSQEMGTVRERECKRARHRMHRGTTLTAFVAFPLLNALPWNVIYAGIAALLAGTLAAWLCRPDLLRKSWVGGLFFLGLYTVFQLGLKWSAPGYIEEV